MTENNHFGIHESLDFCALVGAEPYICGNVGSSTVREMAEWGGWWDREPGTNPGFLYQQNTMRDALIAGVSLNIFNAHADRLRMANIAQTVNALQATILTEGPKMVLTPSYHVFEMYKVHQDATLLPIHVDGERLEECGVSIPAVSASASRDPSGRMHASLCNLSAGSPAAIEIEAQAEGGRLVLALPPMSVAVLELA